MSFLVSIGNVVSDGLAKLLPHRDIRTDGDLYLRRFFVTPRDWPMRVFLHRIYRSDRDRHLHNHPWPFSTFLLTGSYVEELADGKRLRQIWDVRCNDPDHTHRVTLEQPLWTVLLVGPTAQKWGFVVDGKWVYWREYLGETQTASESEEDLKHTPRTPTGFGGAFARGLVRLDRWLRAAQAENERVERVLRWYPQSRPVVPVRESRT